MNMPPSASGLEMISRIPIMIGSAGPQMVSLTAEISDGWMPPSWAPGILPRFQPQLDAGFAKRDGKPDDFAIWAHVDVLVDDDVRVAMRPFKEYVVTWAAMQRPMMEARGYPEVASRLEELLADVPAAEAEARVQRGEPILGGQRWDEALKAIPDEYMDEGWLLGPVPRIAKNVEKWLDSGLTGLIIRYGPQLTHDVNVENLEVFEAIARAAGKEPRG